jgi:N-acylneuraminate cytidylyltransferase/CMP-N,N'-diacetyllegionaminic acid synthase
VYKGKKILAIIPARAGSKGIKYKNLKKINGKTLFHICFKESLKSKYLDKIVISTDIQKIIKETNLCKRTLLVKRPKIYSGDNATMFSVISHVVNFLKKDGKFYDYIAILQVTCPFRKFSDIDNSIKIFINKKRADTLISVSLMDDFHPARMYKKKGFYLQSLDKNKMYKNRQQLEKIYHRNGLIYLFKVSNLEKFNSFYGKKIIPFIIDRNRSLNIDNYNDLTYARAIKKNKVTFT